jgi:sortase A
MMIPPRRWVARVALFTGAGLVLLGCSLAGAAHGYQELVAREVGLRASLPRFEPLAAIPLPDGVVATLRHLRLGGGLFVFPNTGNNLIKGPVWLGLQPSGRTSGNVIIAAHRDTHFAYLKDVRTGDRFEVGTSQERLVYAVNQISIVQRDDRRLLENQSGDVLTLVTCYPFHFIGRAPQRFVVRANLVKRQLAE